MIALIRLLVSIMVFIGFGYGFLNEDKTMIDFSLAFSWLFIILEVGVFWLLMGEPKINKHSKFTMSIFILTNFASGVIVSAALFISGYGVMSAVLLMLAVANSAMHFRLLNKNR